MSEGTGTERPLNYLRHGAIGVAVAIVAPGTAFAWPFAVLAGIILGRADVVRTRGSSVAMGVRIAAGALVLALLVAIVALAGGPSGIFVSLAIAAMAALSERAAADASPRDQWTARMLLLVIPLIGLLLFPELGGAR
jgi:hypothetical protein